MKSMNKLVTIATMLLLMNSVWAQKPTARLHARAAGSLGSAGNFNAVSASSSCDGANFSQPAGSPTAGGADPDYVAVGDFNLDGNLDLATASNSSDNVTILLGDGSGGFTMAAGSPVAVGTSPDSIAVGDFNLDGNPDLPVPNFGSSDLTILLAIGSGQFT